MANDLVKVTANNLQGYATPEDFAQYAALIKEWLAARDEDRDEVNENVADAISNGTGWCVDSFGVDEDGAVCIILDIGD